jgi:hypothetical protein
MNPVGEKTVWEENTPDSLLDLCTRYVIANPHTYCYQVQHNADAAAAAAMADIEDEIDSGSGAVGARGGKVVDGATGGEGGARSKHPTQLALLPDLHLPTEICEKFFDMLQEEGLDVEDMTASAFSDTRTSRLRNVNVRGTSITDEGLLCLLRHNLRSLDISNCEGITRQSLENVNAHSDLLTSLSVGSSAHILPDYIYTREEVHLADVEDDEDSLDEEDRARSVYDARGYIIRAPNLQRLSVRDLFVTRGVNYFDLLLKPLPKLTHLDLTGVVHNEGMGEFEFLTHLPQLVSLVLHNVSALDMAVKTIAQIKTLK